MKNPMHKHFFLFLNLTTVFLFAFSTTCLGSETLFRAVKIGDAQAVKAIIRAGADVNARDGDGYSLLHVAALGDNKEIIEIFIKAGISVNVKDKCNNIPLHMAAARGSKKIIETLIRSGADVNTRNKKKRHSSAYGCYYRKQRGSRNNYKSRGRYQRQKQTGCNSSARGCHRGK